MLSLISIKKTMKGFYCLMQSNCSIKREKGKQLTLVEEAKYKSKRDSKYT